MKLFIISLQTLLIITISCNSLTQKESDNSYDIISLLIQEFGKPTIPPHELLGLPDFSKNQIDSIINQKINISIYPILKNSTKKFKDLSSYETSFHTLINNLEKEDSNFVIDSSRLKIDRPYRISMLDTNKLKNDKYYIKNNFDKLISFSKISFDQHFKKAVVIVSISKGTLNGISVLVLLEKQEDSWTIKSFNTFSIS